MLCYLATALNLPLPLPAAPRSHSDQPFPCQDHTCGCQSAEQCWAGCCCLTPEQRWQWAREHKVEPPAYAEKPRSASWSTTRLRDREQAPEPGKRSCCAKAPVASKPGSCCQHGEQTPATPTEEPQQDDSPSKVRWVLTLAGLKCQGQSTLWVSSAAALPPAPPLTWQPCFRLAGRLAWFDDSATSHRSPPASPPPRS